MPYDIGETIICSVEVKNDAGTLVDPATSMNIVIDQITPQYANKVTSTGMTQDSTGKYHYDCQTASYLPGGYTITYTATDGTRITIKKDTFALE